MKKGFTLAEAMIVIAIIGMLFTVLFQSYLRTAALSLRIENEQTVMNEVLFLNQFLDTISDQSSLHIEGYTGNQLDEHGYVDELLLLDDGNVITLTSEGDCSKQPSPATSGETGYTLLGDTCGLVARYPDRTVQLTDPSKVYLANVRFKIFPTQSYSGNIYTELPLDKIQSRGFQILGHMYHKNYTTAKREFNTHMPIQTFFSMSD